MVGLGLGMIYGDRVFYWAKKRGRIGIDRIVRSEDGVS